MKDVKDIIKKCISDATLLELKYYEGLPLPTAPHSEEYKHYMNGLLSGEMAGKKISAKWVISILVAAIILAALALAAISDFSPWLRSDDDYDSSGNICVPAGNHHYSKSNFEYNENRMYDITDVSLLVSYGMDIPEYNFNLYEPISDVQLKFENDKGKSLTVKNVTDNYMSQKYYVNTKNGKYEFNFSEMLTIPSEIFEDSVGYVYFALYGKVGDSEEETWLTGFGLGYKVADNEVMIINGYTDEFTNLLLTPVDFEDIPALRYSAEAEGESLYQVGRDTVNRPIVCFDVREDGAVILGTEIGPFKTVKGYNADGSAKFERRFYYPGDFAIEWMHEGTGDGMIDDGPGNFAVYLIDDMAADLDGGDYRRIEDIEYNEEALWQIRSSVQESGGRIYRLRNDIGILGKLFTGSSSLTVIDADGNETVISSSAPLQITLIVSAVILLLAATVLITVLIRRKQKIKHKFE